ncbi:MAG: S1 family peptidase [Chloroflexota bacterium]
MAGISTMRWRRRGRRAFLLLSLAASLAAPMLHGPAVAQEKVAGGTPVKTGTMPFVAAIWAKQFPFAPQCVGTLIAPATVLTSASCAYDLYGQENLPAGQLAVSFPGRSGGIFDQRRLRVARIARHPGYDPKRCLAGFGCPKDVAVLTLASTPPGVKPVALVGPDEVRFENPGDRVTIAGWTGDTTNAPGAYMLTQGAMPLIEPRTCKTRYEQSELGADGYPPVRVDLTDIFCTYSEEVGPCWEELGAPSMVRQDGGWRQVGIVNGIGFCVAGKWPVVHTRLSDPETNDWIRRQARKGDRS